MPNLVIDIGNSYYKVAVFENRTLQHFKRIKQLENSDITQLIARFEIKKGIIASVANQAQPLLNYLSKRIDLQVFNTEYNPGIKNEYQSINTLGLDRWAKVIAAFKLYATQNTLLIDAGTCITYDILTQNAVYKGGSISLGIQMRFKALNNYTKRLPLVLFNTSEEIPEGNNTENALKSGVLRGVLAEIEGFIKLANHKNLALKVVLTGGDADFLSKQLKNSIFASQITVDPYLVLRGLNEVIVS